MKRIFASRSFLALGLCLSAGAVQAAPAPLTLEESITIALNNHGDTGASLQRSLSATQNIRSVRSGLLPQASASVNYVYRKSPGASLAGVLSGGSTTTGVSVSQNIFDGGKTRTQVRRARAQELGTVGDFGSVRSGLAYQVAQAFYEQLRQEKLVLQRQSQVALAQEQLAQIDAQIEAGTIARADRLSVQVTLSQARFDLVSSQNSLGVAQVDFRNVLGLERGEKLNLSESSRLDSSVAPPVETEQTESGELLVIPALKPLEAYIQQAQALRPDLLQARATVLQNEATVQLAKIEKRPQVSLNADYNIDPRSTLDREFQIGAGVNFSLFDGGKRSADLKAAEATLAASQIQLEQTEKDLSADVESCYINLAGQVERINNARILVQQAQTNLATATERYQLGLGIVLDIVNAQNSLMSAQTSATQAEFDYEIARANLDRAVGRFAWANPDQPVPEAAPQSIPDAIKPIPVAAPEGENVDAE